MKRSTVITLLALSATAMVYEAGRRERRCEPATPDGQPVDCSSSSSGRSSSRSWFSSSSSKSSAKTSATTRGGFGSSGSSHGSFGG